MSENIRFSTEVTGKKIAKLRKEKNITQMELADTMGVSYQAVSNWERGNSMPDISKLPELAKLLGCSIDELLIEGKEADLVKHVVIGDAEEYVKEERVSAKTVSEVAPILKPKQTERLLDCIIRENKEHLSINDLISIAPFVDEDYLNQWVDKVDIVENLGAICGLAPFLSEEALDKLVEKLQDTGNLSQINGLAPFLSEETLNRLVRKSDQEGDMNQIMGLAPFLSDKTLDFFVTKAIEKGEISSIAGLYPFLSNDTLHKLADALMKKGGFSAIRGIAPFL